MNFNKNKNRLLKVIGQSHPFTTCLPKSTSCRALPVFVSLALIGGVFVSSPVIAQSFPSDNFPSDNVQIDSFDSDEGLDIDIGNADDGINVSITSPSPSMDIDISTNNSSDFGTSEPTGMPENLSVSMDDQGASVDMMAPEPEFVPSVDMAEAVDSDLSDMDLGDDLPDFNTDFDMDDGLPMPEVVSQPDIPELQDMQEYAKENNTASMPNTAASGANVGMPSYSESFSNQSRTNRVTRSTNTPIGPQRYYDSKLGQKRGYQQPVIRKADPEKEPGSRFVVVHKQNNAGDFDSILVAAERAFKLERYNAAHDFYKQLYKKNPRDSRVLMGRAVTLHKMGRVNSAILAYEELLERYPDNPEAVVNLMGLIRQDYPSVALQRLLELKEKNPNNPSILAQIGITHSDMGNNAEAIKYLGMASTLEPDNPQHYFNIAILSEKIRDSAGAVKNYEKALEVDAVYGSGRSVSRELIYDRLTHLRQ